jgi:hypothetical protein
MSDNETKPDYLEDCAVALDRIADALEQIAEILDSCKSHIGRERYALRTIPLNTD